jgi:glyoxylase-like metal-dependent hydrolase (beta-lactamase superfamily II)
MAVNLEIKLSSSTKLVSKLVTDQGANVYQLPIEAFPGFWANAYLVLYEGYKVLIDTGSGYGASNEHLISRLHDVNCMTDLDIRIPKLTHVFITHGHIDHFGGLSNLRRNSPALIGIHELDLRNITNTEERLSIISRRLEIYLTEAGVSAKKRSHLLQMYMLTKLEFSPVLADFTYEAIGMGVGPFKFFHVPGHCAGSVVIQIHDIVFTGDHILSDISPHQAPESLVLNTGLEHYIASLAKLKQWKGGIRLALGGHNGPITDIYSRIEEIRAVHEKRFEEIVNLLIEPKTIYEISKELYQDVHGYNELLAIEEAGAHIEYLYQRGKIGVYNHENNNAREEITPIRYHCS